jgi:cytoskeletal protein CcmA (bactofilin family)
MGITDVAHTIQLPTSVIINTTDIAGYDIGTKIITFAATGNYLFEISSYSGGDDYMIQDLTRAKSKISGNLDVSGNIISNGSAFIGGNVTVTGNLFVNGNTTQVNVETLTVEDPMIDLGGGPAGNVLTNNDTLDRGMLMRYYNAGAINAFMGWDNSAAEFVIGSNVSVSSGLVTVNTLGNVRAGNATLANTTVSRLNTSDARIAGGFADNFPIGANTAAPGAFTTVSATDTIIGSGNIVAAATTASTNTTTGALVVRGGAGISGAVNIGSSLAVDGGVYGNVTINQFASVYGQAYGANPYSIMQVRSNDFATGMGMQTYAGTNGLFYSNTGIQFNTGSTVRDKDFPQGGTSAAQFAANGAFIAQTGIVSTTTGTGAVIVTGGAGVSGNINVGGNLVTRGGIINANFGEFLVINDQLFVANVDYNTFVIDTTSGLTISNLWVSLPDASVNGRTITFSIMSPVTALYLDTITPGGVKYLANTWATSGNAVVQLTYSTTSNKWLRIG